ncbi:hypothetical protein [Streptomyces sp. NBC_01240]|uniref:hypothetical protein n=1 Tax=Streptomyces sp. NBC_01240 TaxID=2903793 RepID=UPI002E0FABD3|nr:hypothetical protein OG466_40810 [Streptomyces sp. NBC_01240]
MTPSTQTVVALFSIALSATSILVALQSRTYRIRAEAAAARAVAAAETSRQHRIAQHLENNGGAARLVVGDREVSTS